MDDHILAGYEKLREALAGELPRTRTGDPVHEMQTIVEWVTSPAAGVENLKHMTRMVQTRPREGEPAGLRATRAQLVHHMLRSIEARVRRDDAVARGASAQPVRDLRQSAWAAPLREQKARFELLVDSVVRLRNGSRDLYGTPAEQLDGLGLDPVTARRQLRAALDQLRSLRPEFYMANVALYLAEGDPMPWVAVHDLSPEDVLIHQEEQEAARRELSRLMADKSFAQRLVVERICAAAALGADTGLVGWAADELGTDQEEAEALVRWLIRNVCRADLDWVVEHCNLESPQRVRR
ncbi:hypothetical protein [Microbispora sp. NPDC049125]|uniref:hypothetical protein n=1 Tax=Microbispora sp. NPDC049125 TaxID=3154929 RepID=UPI0034652385